MYIYIYANASPAALVLILFFGQDMVRRKYQPSLRSKDARKPTRGNERIMNPQGLECHALGSLLGLQQWR